MPKSIALAIALSILTAGLAPAQAIKGQLVVPAARSEERIEVLLEKSDGQVVARTYSDSQGNFMFATTLNSDCYVVIHLDGYNDVRERVIVSSGGSIRLVLNLTPKSAASDSRVSPNSDVVDLSAARFRYPKKILDDYQKAQDDIRKGNALKAAERLQDLLRQAPNFYEAHNTLGAVLQKLDRLEDAAKEYATAHQQSPQWALPLENLGRLHLQIAESPQQQEPNAVQGLLLQARQELQDAVTLDPRSAMSHYLLGAVLYRLADYPQAETQLANALTLAPGMPPARLMSINLDVRLQKWQDALTQIDLFLSENPKAPERDTIQSIRTKVAASLQTPQ